MGTYGYADPLKSVEKLLARLGNETAAIVFHGSNNCAHRYGLKMLASHSLSRKFPLIFSDNLVAEASQMI